MTTINYNGLKYFVEHDELDIESASDELGNETDIGALSDEEYEEMQHRLEMALQADERDY